MEAKPFDRILLGEGYYLIGPLGPHETFHFKHNEKGIDITIGTTELELSAFLARVRVCILTFMSEQSKKILLEWL